uniref:Uncharacterized protein n=1 Tax=Rhizophora mucronata TaxID=61149 RepID=A0A2P2QS44_RHIMU
MPFFNFQVPTPELSVQRFPLVSFHFTLEHFHIYVPCHFLSRAVISCVSLRTQRDTERERREHWCVGGVNKYCKVGD